MSGRSKRLSAASEGAGDPPGVGLLVAVVERLQALLFLLLAEARRVRHFEEGGCKLHQPARVDGGHLSHVLFGGQHQLMVHNPADEKEQKSHTVAGGGLLLTVGQRRTRTTQVAG